MLKSHKTSYKLGRTSVWSSSWRIKLTLHTLMWWGGTILEKPVLKQVVQTTGKQCVSLLNGHWLMVCCCFCPLPPPICLLSLVPSFWQNFCKLDFGKHSVLMWTQPWFHQISNMYVFYRPQVKKEQSHDCMKIQNGRDLWKVINLYDDAKI